MSGLLGARRGEILEAIPILNLGVRDEVRHLFRQLVAFVRVAAGVLAHVSVCHPGDPANQNKHRQDYPG